jgi:hypothetical protein
MTEVYRKENEQLSATLFTVSILYTDRFCHGLTEALILNSYVKTDKMFYLFLVIIRNS